MLTERIAHTYVQWLDANADMMARDLESVAAAACAGGGSGLWRLPWSSVVSSGFAPPKHHGRRWAHDVAARLSCVPWPALCRQPPPPETYTDMCSEDDYPIEAHSLCGLHQRFCQCGADSPTAAAAAAAPALVDNAVSDPGVAYAMQIWDGVAARVRAHWLFVGSGGSASCSIAWYHDDASVHGAPATGLVCTVPAGFHVIARTPASARKAWAARLGSIAYRVREAVGNATVSMRRKCLCVRRSGAATSCPPPPSPPHTS